MIEPYSVKGGRLLRRGFTTGTCAAAASYAACMRLLTGLSPERVSVNLPSGGSLQVAVDGYSFSGGSVKCRVIKDAGDDPDVTDGIRITAEVSKTEKGIFIDGGTGVGRVTRPGLRSPVGEAAINPVPRKMIEAAVREAAEASAYEGGLKIIISAEGGCEIALKTFNPRLGIEGGVSILGTTGIVEPMSERAIVETVRLEIDSRAAAGKGVLLMTPGNYGRDFTVEKLGIDIDAGVKCSNYIGEALDYALFKGFKSVLLVGHAGKLCKLAGGIMNTHSSVADCRREIFAAHAALAGAAPHVLSKIMDSGLTGEITGIIENAGIADAVWNGIINKIHYYMNARLKGASSGEAVVFTGVGDRFRATPGAFEMINKLKGK